MGLNWQCLYWDRGFFFMSKFKSLLGFGIPRCLLNLWNIPVLTSIILSLRNSSGLLRWFLRFGVSIFWFFLFKGIGCDDKSFFSGLLQSWERGSIRIIILGSFLPRDDHPAFLCRGCLLNKEVVGWFMGQNGGGGVAFGILSILGIVKGYVLAWAIAISFTPKAGRILFWN